MAIAQQQLGVLAEHIASQERKLKLLSSSLGQILAELQTMIGDVEWDRARVEGLCASTRAIETSSSDATTVETPTMLCEPPSMAASVDADHPTIAPSPASDSNISADTVLADPIAVLLEDVAAAIKPSAGLMALLDQPAGTDVVAEAALPPDAAETAFEVADTEIAAPTAPVATEFIAILAEHHRSPVTLADIEGQMTRLELVADAAPSPSIASAASTDDELGVRELPPHIVALLTPQDPTKAPAETSNLIQLATARKRNRVLVRLTSTAASLLVLAGSSFVYRDLVESSIGAHLARLGACSTAAVAADRDCAMLVWLAL